MLGRVFEPEEERPGANRIAVLSHAGWQQRFRGERDVIGRSLMLDDIPYTVVGVMPPEFYFPDRDTELWTPLSITIPNQRPGNVAIMVSASLSQSRAVTSLLVTFAVVGLALGVIGIAAVASYAVRRRRREIGLRLALGAMPAQVVRQVTAEQMRPALVGLGLATAVALARSMESLVYGVGARDGVTCAMLAGVVLVATTLATAVCAFRAAAIDPSRALREG